MFFNGRSIRFGSSLSLARDYFPQVGAREVIDYLVLKHGLLLQRLIRPFGCGSDKPVVDNELPEVSCSAEKKSFGPLRCYPDLRS